MSSNISCKSTDFLAITQQLLCRKCNKIHFVLGYSEKKYYLCIVSDKKALANATEQQICVNFTNEVCKKYALYV